MAAEAVGARDIMRVCFVRHSLLNRGGDKMIAAYASHLAEAGHRVVIRTNVADTVFELSPRVLVEPLHFPGKAGTILSVLCGREAADVVVADIIPMALFLSLRNKRVLYFAQDYNENSYPAALQKLFIRLLYVLGLRWLRIPVVAVSQELGALFRERFGCTGKVIQNGVDLKTFYRDPAPELVAAKGEGKAVLFFSRRDYRKGFDLALATVARLARQLPGLTVWTVGEELEEGEVPCARRDFGYVRESELRRIMSSADLFLYPSRSEGFPLMVLEAFACGCPVVTTEAIVYARDNDNALVARIGDPDALAERVLRLLGDEALAHELADNAGRFVVDYSLPNSAREFEATLKAQMER